MAEITPPAFLSFSPIALYKRKLLRRLGRPISFHPNGPVRGQVLLSYVAHPFCITRAELLRSPHTNPWETLFITEVLLARGYVVDVIDWTNTTFTPRTRYDALIDIHRNLARLAPRLPGAKKIFYSTGAQWKFNNDAEEQRLASIQERRGAVLKPRRAIPPETAAEVADHILALSAFAAATYAPTNKPVAVLPLFTAVSFPAPHKPWDAIRKHFMFISGGGAAHKGLDLVLEAFANLPEYSLVVCGPMTGEEDFAEAYARELSLPNIRTTGRINIRGEEFKRMIDSSVGLVYPSCSEGQAGSVLTGLAAGLIPIVTPQSGVEVEPFGLTIPQPTVDAITQAIKTCASYDTSELERRSTEAWHSAEKAHTPTAFKSALAAALGSYSL